MITKNPFKKGDRLRMNAFGLTNFPARSGVLATVIATPRRPDQVRVLFDGFSSRESFTVSYFEPAEPAPAPVGTAAPRA